MIEPNQLRELVVQPTLHYLDPEIPYSEDAVELLLLTAAHESKLGTYLKQVGGPALSLFQMEPVTHDDIHISFLSYKDSLMEKIANLCLQSQSTKFGFKENLVGNMFYSTAMARVHYYRVPEALPPKEDIEAMAKYAKRHYNTFAGKAKWEDYAKAYKQLVLKEK